VTRAETANDGGAFHLRRIPVDEGDIYM
jgi:hypothetical protein